MTFAIIIIIMLCICLSILFVQCFLLAQCSFRFNSNRYYLLLTIGEVLDNEQMDYVYYKEWAYKTLLKWQRGAFSDILLMTSATANTVVSPVLYIRSILINNGVDRAQIKILYDSIDPPQNLKWELVNEIDCSFSPEDLYSNLELIE